MGQKPHVVIIGGGFGGLHAAQTLGRNKFRVTLIDRRNFHLFQPLLYQVATGFLAPGDIAAPLRSILRRHRSTEVLQTEVTDIIPNEKCVVTKDGKISYDRLIIAAGMTHSYFGHDDWEQNAPGLKTVEDAVEVRRKVLSAFEAAERTDDLGQREKLLTFIIIGGGPTGVELAGAFAELARSTMKGEFRKFEPSSARIVLVEGGKRVLSSYSEPTSKYARSTLEKLGVEILSDTVVQSVSSDHVVVKHADKLSTISGYTVVWAAGVTSSPLARVLGDQAGLKCDRHGRIPVEPDLSLSGHPDIFVIGDIALLPGKDGKPLPGVAPVAIQQGKYVARLITRQAVGKTTSPFRYLDKGNMAVIGRGRAVAETWRLRLTGFPAWVAWAFIHIYFLIEFENKIIVFVHWAWNYVTNQRGSRIITEKVKDI